MKRFLSILALAAACLFAPSAFAVIVQITPASATVQTNGTQQFTGVALNVGCQSNAVTWSLVSGTGTINSSGLFTAPNTAETDVIKATSVAYHTYSATATITVTAPAAPPAPTITAHPANPTNSIDPTFTFDDTLPGVSFLCSMDGGTYTACSSPKHYSPLSSASHTFAVEATNANGTSTPTSYTWTINTTAPPAPTITSGPANPTTLTTATFVFNDSQGGVSFLCSLDGAAFATCASPVNYTSLSQASHTFSVEAQDSSGNTSPVTNYPWTIGSTPPPPSGGQDGPATLPLITINSSLANTPAPGATTAVGVGTITNIQTALNNANCGDTIQLVHGTTYSGGRLNFPNKACDDTHWIIVESDAGASLPAEGSILSPCYAGVASLPGRPNFNCSSTADVVATLLYTGPGNGPITFSPGANHYRLIGLEVTHQAGTANYGLYQPSQNVNHIILDRVWFHGTAQDETSKGVGLSGTQYISIVNSTFTDFHCISAIGTCTDAQAIGGGLDGVQAGPFKIDGNFLEAAGQGILFGGGGANFTPADITITHNHIFKPLTWLVGQAGFVGGVDTKGACPKTPGQCPFIVKNQFELKNAQRVLFEGNLVENVWGGYSQVGFSILLTPKNQASGTQNVCPLCFVQNITIRYNKVSHAGTGIAIANAPSDNGGFAAAGNSYSLHDNVLDDISASKYNGGGAGFQVAGSSAEVLHDVDINHNTVFPDPTSKIISLGGPSASGFMYNFTFTNNLIGQTNKFPIWSTGGLSNCAVSNVPLTSLNTCFPPSAGGYIFTNNGLTTTNFWNGAYPASKWPTGQLFPTDLTTVVVNLNGGNGGDYHVLVSAPEHNAGTDGKDIGADIDTVNTDTGLAPLP